MSYLGLIAMLSTTTMQVAPDLAPEDRLALEAAANAIEYAGACSDAHPRWRLDQAVRLRDTRHGDLDLTIADIWGRLSDVDAASPRGACSRSKVLAALKEADGALDQVAAAFAKASEPMRSGIWIGPLQLCHDTVLSARVDEPIITGHPVRPNPIEREIARQILGLAPSDSKIPDSGLEVWITLRAKAAGIMKELTERTVGGRLALRINGKIIMTANVLEPIENGKLDLFVSRTEFAGAEKFLTNPC